MLPESTLNVVLYETVNQNFIYCINTPLLHEKQINIFESYVKISSLISRNIKLYFQSSRVDNGYFQKQYFPSNR